MKCPPFVEEGRRPSAKERRWRHRVIVAVRQDDDDRSAVVNKPAGEAKLT